MKHTPAIFVLAAYTLNLMAAEPPVCDWVFAGGGNKIDRAYGAATDPADTAYVTVHFESTDAITGAINRQIFCTKYDADGRELWHQTTSGTVSGSGHGIAVDASDHIYLGDNASGSGAFGQASIESKTTAALVVKLNPQGDAIWASVIPGTPSALYHQSPATRQAASGESVCSKAASLSQV